MADDAANWFLAVGDDVEIAELVLEPSDGAPSISCRACGRDSLAVMHFSEPALRCPCGAVILEIVARL